jgi:hypothetical protein
MSSNIRNPIVAQKRQPRQSEKRVKKRSPQEHRQLALFDSQQVESVLPLKRQKPQISSTPNIPPRERNRYRVTLEGQIIGDKLTLDEAVALANGGEG